MRSRQQLLSEAKAARDDGNPDQWWATLTEDERAIWWEIVNDVVRATTQIVALFREWLRGPLINFIDRFADWYEALPEETRQALEEMGE